MCVTLTAAAGADRRPVLRVHPGPSEVVPRARSLHLRGERGRLGTVARRARPHPSVNQAAFREDCALKPWAQRVSV